MGEVNLFDLEDVARSLGTVDAAKTSAITLRIALRGIPFLLVYPERFREKPLLLSMLSLLNCAYSAYCPAKLTNQSEIQVAAKLTKSMLVGVASGPDALGQVVVRSVHSALDIIGAPTPMAAAASVADTFRFSYNAFEFDPGPRSNKTADDTTSIAAWQARQLTKAELNEARAANASSSEQDLVNARSGPESPPLWQDNDVPQRIKRLNSQLIDFMAADPAWAFWLRFYLGVWKGEFHECDLALEVIRIPEGD